MTFTFSLVRQLVTVLRLKFWTFRFDCFFDFLSFLSFVSLSPEYLCFLLSIWNLSYVNLKNFSLIKCTFLSVHVEFQRKLSIFSSPNWRWLLSYQKSWLIHLGLVIKSKVYFQASLSFTKIMCDEYHNQLLKIWRKKIQKLIL